MKRGGLLALYGGLVNFGYMAIQSYKLEERNPLNRIDQFNRDTHKSYALAGKQDWALVVALHYPVEVDGNGNRNAYLDKEVGKPIYILLVPDWDGDSGVDYSWSIQGWGVLHAWDTVVLPSGFMSAIMTFKGGTGAPLNWYYNEAKTKK